MSLHDLRRKLPSFVRSLRRYYDLIRLLTRVHARRAAFAFPSRPGTSPGTGETSQVPRKELPHVRKVSDCARFFPCKPFAMGRCCLLFLRTRSAPRNWTRFAAQYLARGLPCERFTAALASRTSCITRGRGGWLDLPRGGLAPPILCQLPGALCLGAKADADICNRGGGCTPVTGRRLTPRNACVRSLKKLQSDARRNWRAAASAPMPGRT